MNKFKLQKINHHRNNESLYKTNTSGIVERINRYVSNYRNQETQRSTNIDTF